MHLDATDLRDRERALADEWLLADGAGGYASMTPLFSGTRRYHALWAPAMNPPVDRRVVLAHVEDKLHTGDGVAWFGTCEYSDGFYPDGSGAAEAFTLDPLPALTSESHGVRVRRELFLRPEQRGVCLTYEVEAARHWQLEIAPFLAMRSIHALIRSSESHRVDRQGDVAGFRTVGPDLPEVHLWLDTAARVKKDPLWYYGVVRRVERERGFDFSEDLLVPGTMTVDGHGDAVFHLFCSFDTPSDVDAEKERETALASTRSVVADAGDPADDRLRRLVRATDAFIVRRSVGEQSLATVIAGYPWFSDWGRDAMIALPGLAIETGRVDLAGRILAAFAVARSGGLIPNRFAEETGHADYNTVDASLWFLQAASAFLREGGDADLVRERLWPAVVEVVERYRDGTQFGIGTDTDGLVTAGSPRTQLTWMDAQVEGHPVTPRFGKAVEINALWVSGLALVAELAEDLGLAPPQPPADHDTLKARFLHTFWNEATGCLFDCVYPDGGRDGAIRPNQIMAVGLPYAPVGGERGRSVVRTVREKLLTPRGLRTLAPDHPDYVGTYEGGPNERDAAYHQGTVWPWLLGPYADAVFAVERSECARGEVGQLLDGLLDTMDEAGLGQISEIFDGDPPHRPRGCIAQAWSVAAAVHLWRLLESSGGLP